MSALPVNRHARLLPSYQRHDRAFDDVAVSAVVQQSVRQPKNANGDAGRANSSHVKPRFNRGTGGDATIGRLHEPYGIYGPGTFKARDLCLIAAFSKTTTPFGAALLMNSATKARPISSCSIVPKEPGTRRPNQTA
jgi:hypothetical protein